jgi:ring-1,2-phenylacetyl-CoA epoxidase subunit PaaC
VAANFLLDTALTMLLESACQSSLGPLAQRARRIMEEEPMHWLHAEGWTRRLSAIGPGVKQALTVSLTATSPHCLQIFAAAAPELVQLGVLDTAAPTLLERFQHRIHPVMQSAGLPPL